MTHPRLDDPDRLAALNALELTDHDPGPAFERLARLARLLLAAPVALVSLVDDRRQVVLGQVGLDVPPGARVAIPIEESVCAHVITDGGELLVTDLRDRPVLCAMMSLMPAYRAWTFTYSYVRRPPSALRFLLGSPGSRSSSRYMAMSGGGVSRRSSCS